MKTLAALILLVIPSALAHLQLMDPFPLRSSLNPATPEQYKDYSMTTPLVANGLPYPCKGYLNSDPSIMGSQKTWPAGSSQSFTIAPPGATHGGGSCQLVLSYDKGKTWNVIFSYIGGCMVEDLTIPFTIPKEAPGGEVVFGWTWFNRMGNREMYENCAIVTITNGGSGLNPTDHPAPFVANAGGFNGCSTIEGIDIVFPNPGKNVKYSGPYKGTVPPAGQGIKGSGCSDGDGNSAGTRGNTGSGSGNTPAAPAGSQATTPPANAKPSTPAATTAPAPTQNLVASPSSSSTSTLSTASSAPSAAPTKARTCRRRRSASTSTAAAAVVRREELQGLRQHRSRLVRRPRGRPLGHGDLAARQAQEAGPGAGAGTGRVAAMKAEYPVYAQQ